MLNPGLTAVLAESTDFQSGTQDHYEQIFSPFNDLGNRLVVCLFAGADKPQ